MLKTKRLLAAIFLIFAVFAAASASAQDADEALTLLKEGNARFVEMKMQHPNVSAERRTDTALNGQKPFAAILSCSDSRVPVEDVFDRGIGDIFVVRVAGNVAMDPSVIGSVEYAAGHLDRPLVVILGHTNCGAVKASILGPDLEGDLPFIQRKIEGVAARVKKDHPNLQGDDLISAVVKENVLKAREDLLAKSAEIRHMVEEGKLKIVPAVYDLETGVVEWI